MNNSRMTHVLLGSLCIGLLGGCNEDDQLARSGGGDAPREVCTEQVVTRQKPVKDEHRVAGTVAGALVGAVVGNEIGGKGTSGDIATAGGAVAGGYAGNRVQKSVQENATEQTTEVVCRPVSG